MEPVVFSMSGNPRGKGRPRVTTRGRYPVVYTDSLTRKYERSIHLLARAAMGEQPPLEGPLGVSLRFRLQPPKSMTKRLRAAVLAGEEPYLGSVDVDNLAKAVLDGMNGAAFVDDKQIVRLFVTKVAHEKPGVDVRIEAFGMEASA